MTDNHEGHEGMGGGVINEDEAHYLRELANKVYEIMRCELRLEQARSQERRLRTAGKTGAA
jgi:hypothetical protein